MTERKITNQNDIDEYIEHLLQQAEKELEVLFAERLKVIKRELAEMYAKYESDDPHATWTEFNKYNRLNKQLARIADMMTGDYREVAKAIKKTQQNVYIEQYMMSLFLYEMASQTSMQFDIPTANIINKAIEQPIEFIKLVPTLQKHRSEVLKRLRVHITQGILSGEGYARTAKVISDDLGMSKAQALRVARTETGRALSQANLDSAHVAQDNGFKMMKRWHATKDTRTRDTHRHLDGKSIPLDDNFKSSGCIGQAPKLFVGVNSARENINCRCKLLHYIDEDDLPGVMRVRNDNGTTEVIPNMTYSEWEKMKRKGG
ncbi:phage head morphogenesis protein [Staphylococcus pseudintermedius]|nr:phage head morphogenesis protein [Staphylococcus pseudintermedius]EIU0335528.1 phage head morphogenesis protein [Staphylococcus pseudintermedius]EJL1587347.1 phage head morphogenesis protein [Staphylococcus pseudintermedius]ELK4586689.1 phage head morphogenesis protein [Staphylococcus pseudintermedius]EMB9439912.1 phage head morphogenesis protein [Staphylococcus pseudintermedius]